MIASAKLAHPASPAQPRRQLTSMIQLLRDVSARVGQTDCLVFSGADLERGRELIAEYDTAFQALLDRTGQPATVHSKATAFAEWAMVHFAPGHHSQVGHVCIGAAGECAVCGGPKQRADVSLCLDCGAQNDAVEPSQADVEACR